MEEEMQGAGGRKARAASLRDSSLQSPSVPSELYCVNGHEKIHLGSASMR